MGLDMYLTASNFFWTHEENESIKEAPATAACAVRIVSNVIG